MWPVPWKTSVGVGREEKKTSGSALVWCATMEQEGLKGDGVADG